MRRNNITWTEEKWAKFMVAVDATVSKTKNHGDNMCVEDYLDTLILVNRRIDKKIDWTEVNNHLINRLYVCIKEEAKVVDFNLELGMTECFAGWWK